MVSFRALNDKEKRIFHLFLQLQNRRHQRGGAHHYNGYQGNEQAGGNIYFNTQSQVEATLSKYGGGGTPGGNLETPTHQGADGKQYPYNPGEPSYLSILPVDWSGCYKCGKDDHWKREFCPEGNNQDPQLMETFHKELKCHKPAVSRPAYAPRVS